jgi:hypothetical protein
MSLAHAGPAYLPIFRSLRVDIPLLSRTNKCTFEGFSPSLVQQNMAEGRTPKQKSSKKIGKPVKPGSILK